MQPSYAVPAMPEWAEQGPTPALDPAAAAGAPPVMLPPPSRRAPASTPLASWPEVGAGLIPPASPIACCPLIGYALRPATRIACPLPMQGG